VATLDASLVERYSTMKTTLVPRNPITGDPAHLHLEPVDHDDMRVLCKLIDNFPDAVAGYGMDPDSGVVIHLQLRLTDIK
jgi:hypothetical protein